MEPSLSSKFREARAQRGLSLADVAHATRIPVARLQQLEQGNLAAFGNMAYAAGFIRLYSEFLGIEASSFVKDLPRPILGGPNDYRHLIDSFGPWVEEHPRAKKGSAAARKAVPASTQGIYALVLFLALCVCTGVLAANFLHLPGASNLKAKPAPMPAVTMAKSLSTGIAVPAKPISAAPIKIKPQAPQAAPVGPKLISFATPPAPEPREEVRPPDVSKLPSLRAVPVEEGELDPDVPQ